jgi:hypothetical protein
VRIPSGDLAPARKRRRGYSARRRRRNPLPIAVAVLLVAGIALGAYWIRRDDSSPSTVTAGARCPSAAPSPTARAAAVTAPAKAAPVRLPAPGQVALRLFNGTTRAKLALTVGNELARRGFRVTGFTNAPKPLTGGSRVYFGPGGRPAATLVSAHILGSQIVPVPTAGRGAVDAVLGSTFVRLRTPAEVSAYARQLAAGRVPAAPTPAAPAPVPSPTCR